MLQASPPAGTGTRGAGVPDRALEVVVVAATRVRQTRLQRLLELAGVAVLGQARDSDGTLELLARVQPHVLVLDLPPHAGGLELVERLMARRPLPIVLTGAAAVDPGASLALGAVDVLSPQEEGGPPADQALRLLRHLQVASRVRVITHPRGRLPSRRTADTPEHPGQPGTGAVRAPGPGPIVAIGASTGGPPALATLLAALPADLPAPVVVVQHMADGFVASLATWLGGVSNCPVSVAEDDQRLVPGRVVIAPSHANLELGAGGRVQLTAPRPGQLHVPEVDTTFLSVAERYGARAVGVLLTGMGRDGAVGLRAMRDAGAYTIGQDEQSCAVWGMPAAARSLGAVRAELPLAQIAEAIATAVAKIAVPAREPA